MKGKKLKWIISDFKRFEINHFLLKTKKERKQEYHFLKSYLNIDIEKKLPRFMQDNLGCRQKSIPKGDVRAI